MQAAAHQAAPVALVPAGDPMVLNNSKHNLQKLNAYRAGVNQPTVAHTSQANTGTYCQNLLNVGAAAIKRDQQFTQQIGSPAPTSTNLFTFLATRFSTTFGPDGLKCNTLLKVANPVTLTQIQVTTDATINIANKQGDEFAADPAADNQDPTQTTDNSGSSGLSTGAIVGIAVGGVAGIALVAVIAFVVVKKLGSSHGQSASAQPLYN